jgi:hypothetical protein
MGQGSIFGTIAVGLASLVAVGAIAWGALNLTASKHSAAVQTPIVLDRGGRADTVVTGPMPYSPAKAERSTRFVGGSADNLVGNAGNVTPRFDTQASHPRHIPAN